MLLICLGTNKKLFISEIMKLRINILPKWKKNKRFFVGWGIKPKILDNNAFKRELAEVSGIARRVFKKSKFLIHVTPGPRVPMAFLKKMSDEEILYILVY